MLDLDKVAAVFSLFSDLEGEALERWRGNCETAARRLERRIRKEVDVAAEMEGLCTAAAAMAYGDYRMVQSAGGESDEVQVGEIRLKRSAGTGDSGRDAGEIAAYFLEGISHLLTPDCPALLAVEAP